MSADAACAVSGQDNPVYLTEAVRHRHVPAFDGLRGLAATLVLVHHFFLAGASIFVIDVDGNLLGRAIDHWGHNAVLLFFCLSGLVLQIAYQRDPSVSFWRYLVRRFFRLYPAILVVLALIVIITVALKPEKEAWMGNWLGSAFYPTVSMPIIIHHILLTGVGIGEVGLDVPLWSLVYEMRFSILFPLMAFICRRRPAIFAILAAIVYSVAMVIGISRGVNWPFLFGWGRLNSLILTFIYLPFFAAGMLVARWVIGSRLVTPGWIEALVAAAAAVVFSSVHDQLVVVLAMIALLVSTITGRHMLRVLAGRLFLWLGRVSYSLYLVHVPVMFVLLSVTHGWLSPLAALVLAGFVSFALAALIHRYVELPGIWLGRRATQRVRPVDA